MSFADGLHHERAEKDQQERLAVNALIIRLSSRRCTATDINDAIKYLEKYAQGERLT